MLILRTLGTLSLENGAGPVTGAAAQRGRLAVLAVLAAAGDRGISRDRLLALLWPESQTANARGALKQALYALRRDTGVASLVTGSTELRLDPATVRTDVDEFERCIDAGELRHAVALYRGPFLDGVHLRGGEELDRWIERERDRLATLHRDVLDRLGRHAEREGDLAEAIRWRRALVSADPLSAASAAALVRVLVLAGDRPAAVAHARTFEAFVASELGTEPDGNVARLATELRLPATGVTSSANDQLLAIESTNGGNGARTVAALASSDPPSPSAREEHAPFKRWNIAIGAALLAVVAVGVAVWRTPDSPGGADTRARLVVIPFENPTADSSVASLGLVAADWITQGIAAAGLVEVVSSIEAAHADRLLSARAGSRNRVIVAREIAHALQATLAVTGSVTLSGDSAVFQSQIVDVRKGAVLRAVSAVERFSPSSAPVASIRDRVLGALSTVVDERFTTSMKGTSQPPSLSAYQHYADGMTSFVLAGAQGIDDPQGSRRRFAEAAERFELAAAQDSSFTLPVIWADFAWNNAGRVEDALRANRKVEAVRPRLGPIERAMADYALASRRKDHEAALAAARVVTRYLRDSDWQLKVAMEAQRTGRLSAAMAAFDQVDTSRVSWGAGPLYWAEKMDLFHVTGDCSGELRAIHEFAKRFPNREWNGPFVRFRALACQGTLAEALVELDTLIAQSFGSLPAPLFFATGELRAHGHGTAADSVERAALARWLAPQLSATDTKADPLAPLYLSVLLTHAGRFAEATSLANQVPDSVVRVSLRAQFLLMHIAVRIGDRALGARVLRAAERWKEPMPGALDYPMLQAAFEGRFGDPEKGVHLLDAAARASEAPFRRFNGFDWWDVHAGLVLPESLLSHPRVRQLFRPRD